MYSMLDDGIHDLFALTVTILGEPAITLQTPKMIRV